MLAKCTAFAMLCALSAAQNQTLLRPSNATSGLGPIVMVNDAGESTTGVNYAEHGRYYFTPLTTNNTFELRQYLDSVPGWKTLGPYLAIARNLIASIVTVDWGE